jgi:hypothetical protein
MSDDRVGGLDDLFTFAEEPLRDDEPAEVVERRRPRIGRWLGNALLIAIATTVTVAVTRANGIRVSILLVIAAFVALRLLMLAVSEVAPPPLPKPVRGVVANTADNDGLYRWTGTDLLRTAVRGWERRLGWAQSDHSAFSRNVLPVLAELADERLRLRHGITRASDPRRARELLGEPIWQMLGEPGRKAPKARELTAYVETLERL